MLKEGPTPETAQGRRSDDEAGAEV